MDTIQYYNDNAEKFSTDTRNVDFAKIQNKFLKYLNPESKIMDLGCGSGRDTMYFIQRGFQVDAVDGSIELCKIASEFTGQEVKQMLFHELYYINTYDGIWACASILHLPYEQLKTVFQKIADALKEAGIFYTSFKYGEREGNRNGRYFTDMTESKFKKLLDEVSVFEIKEIWVSRDVRVERGEEKWLNVILVKKDDSK